MARVLLIAGTGTDVGKTHVTCALLVGLRARAPSIDVAAMKPVATGVSDGIGEDALAHAAALGAKPRPSRFVFAAPVAPSLAARALSSRIDVDVIVRDVLELARTHDVVVVETAGGLFTPLGAVRGTVVTNASLALALSQVIACELVLVAPDRVGVLHDLGACLLAAAAAGLPPAHVVLSAPLQADASTGTNAEEARVLGITDVAGVFPRAAHDAPATTHVARTLIERLAI